MRQILFLGFFCVALVTGAEAQGVVYQMTNEQAYNSIDRLAVKGLLALPVAKPYTRGQILMQLPTNVPVAVRSDVHYLQRDNTAWGTSPQAPPQYPWLKRPILRYFYKNDAYLGQVSVGNFLMTLNPITSFSMGRDRYVSDSRLFYNQRGVEVTGSIDKRLYFYSLLQESQARFPEYVHDKVRQERHLPGAGLYKPFESDYFGVKNGYDFLNAQGLMGAQLTKGLDMQIGHGRHFIGSGQRSLFLSDFANNYFYLRLQGQYKKWRYQSILAEVQYGANSFNNANPLLPKKYAVFNYLQYQAHQNWQFGLFEATIYPQNNTLKWYFLNPLPLFNTVARALDFRRATLLGLDFRGHLWHRVAVYGQWIADARSFKALSGRSVGDWRRQWGGQLGAKYIDVFGVPHLEAQIEYNQVRPYLYGYSDSSATYTHSFQPLAHPLGANFKEWVGTLRYQPHPTVILNAQWMNARVGEDVGATAFGQNPNTPQTARLSDQARLLQGAEARIAAWQIQLSYAFFHNMYIDFTVGQRRKSGQQASQNQNSAYYGAGLRINMAPAKMWF